MNVLTRITLMSAAAAAVLPLALAGPAAAKGHDGSSGRSGGAKVVSSGACSGGGVWKLKAKHDDGLIEWEFEVDTNRVGQTWRVSVKDNGATLFSGARGTLAPSGSFSVERKTADKVGGDRIVATASRGAASCTGVVTV